MNIALGYPALLGGQNIANNHSGNKKKHHNTQGPDFFGDHHFSLIENLVKIDFAGAALQLWLMSSIITTEGLPPSLFGERQGESIKGLKRDQRPCHHVRLMTGKTPFNLADEFSRREILTFLKEKEFSSAPPEFPKIEV